MNRYRLWSNGKKYKIQKKMLFKWVWLDETGAWDNLYGAHNPLLFFSYREVRDYLSHLRFIPVQEIVV